MSIDYYKLSPKMNLFVLVVCTAASVYFIFKIYQMVDLKYNSNTTEGVITGHYKKKGKAKFIWNRKDVFAPVFIYKHSNGNDVKIVTTNYRKELLYKKGDKVRVFYKTENPSNAGIDTSFNWLRNILLLAVGLLGIYYTIGNIINRKM